MGLDESSKGIKEKIGNNQRKITEALQHQQWDDGEEPAKGTKNLQQII